MRMRTVCSRCQQSDREQLPGIRRTEEGKSSRLLLNPMEEGTANFPLGNDGREEGNSPGNGQAEDPTDLMRRLLTALERQSTASQAGTSSRQGEQ